MVSGSRLALIRRYHELGVDRAVFTVHSAQRDIVSPALDEIDAIMAGVNPDNRARPAYTRANEREDHPCASA